MGKPATKKNYDEAALSSRIRFNFRFSPFVSNKSWGSGSDIPLHFKAHSLHPLQCVHCAALADLSFNSLNGNPNWSVMCPFWVPHVPYWTENLIFGVFSSSTSYWSRQLCDTTWVMSEIASEISWFYFPLLALGEGMGSKFETMRRNTPIFIS